jgi:hypothetical protein
MSGWARLNEIGIGRVNVHSAFLQMLAVMMLRVLRQVSIQSKNATTRCAPSPAFASDSNMDSAESEIQLREAA